MWLLTLKEKCGADSPFASLNIALEVLLQRLPIGSSVDTYLNESSFQPIRGDRLGCDWLLVAMATSASEICSIGPLISLPKRIVYTRQAQACLASSNQYSCSCCQMHPAGSAEFHPRSNCDLQCTCTRASGHQARQRTENNASRGASVRQTHR